MAGTVLAERMVPKRRPELSLTNPSKRGKTIGVGRHSEYPCLVTAKIGPVADVIAIAQLRMLCGTNQQDFPSKHHKLCYGSDVNTKRQGTCR